jgi:galactose oxidase
MMAPSWLSSALLVASFFGSAVHAERGLYRPPPQAILDAENITMPAGAVEAAQASVGSAQLSSNGWTATADSSQNGNPASNAINGNPGDFWHTMWTPNTPGFPHTFTIDMKALYVVNGISYVPRQDGGNNGNIGAHEIYISTDNNNWKLVAYGTWLDDNTEKSGDFENIPARYVRIISKSEAGNRGPWSSAAEFKVFGSKTYMDRTGWTTYTDSAQGGNPGNNVLDGNPNSFWHTQYNPNLDQLPHRITIDMQKTQTVNGLYYLPRQDGQANGNVGQYQVYVSNDNANWQQVATGTWGDDNTQKSATFPNVNCRWIRLRANSEAGNRGPWSSAAEINVSNDGGFTAPPLSKGQWGPTIDFPLVPVAASVQPNTGKVVAWSSWSARKFGGNGGLTVTAMFDPNAKTVTQRIVTNTGHDMFCPSISMDQNGQTYVTGGDTSQKASLYNPGSDTWSSRADLKIPRGYHASATLSDGRIFIIGGSWSGGTGGKNGEIYNPTSNANSLLPGCPVAPMLTADQAGIYRQDNHGMLFGWKQGSVFQAGPSKAMNWYSTGGNGGTTKAGTRSDDNDAMCGIAAMYDAVNGKILVAGGSKDYSNSGSTSNAYRITIGAANAAAGVQKLGNMHSNRIFHNSVVLPNGQVFISGGQTVGQPFSDANSIYTPELWDPNTGAFTEMATNSVARVYHSLSLLLMDGTVFSGGGGLCDTCSTNHFDAQIWTPPYLLTGGARPVINSVSTGTVNAGGQVTVNTNGPVTAMSMVRFGSATHSVNTDQRRIPLTIASAGTNSYKFTVPNDYGIALPGYYMLFAMNAAGVPSVAKTIRVSV